MKKATVNVKGKHIKKVTKASASVKKQVKILQEATSELRKATAELQDALRRIDNITPLQLGEKEKVA